MKRLDCTFQSKFYIIPQCAKELKDLGSTRIFCLLGECSWWGARDVKEEKGEKDVLSPIRQTCLVLGLHGKYTEYLCLGQNIQMWEWKLRGFIPDLYRIMDPASKLISLLSTTVCLKQNTVKYASSALTACSGNSSYSTTVCWGKDHSI